MAAGVMDVAVITQGTHSIRKTERGSGQPWGATVVPGMERRMKTRV